jgi:DNA-binding protein YbaB
MLWGVTSIPTPDEWLANFNATVADVKAKAEAFQQELEHSGATESAPDGSLSVTVAPNGSLTNLHIDDAAWRGSGAELAGKIMQLARKAQRAAAMNVVEAFTPLGGPDDEALHMITGYVPEPEEEDETPTGPSYSFDETRDPSAAPPENSGEPPRRPGRPPRRRDVNDPGDDDYGDDDLFSR